LSDIWLTEANIRKLPVWKWHLARSLTTMGRMLLRNFAKSVTLTALWLSSVIVMIAEEQPRLRYAVIYSDSDGRTHFREEFFPWQKTQSSDPKTLVMQTPFVDAQKLGFLTIPRGYSSEWHPAPGKRFVIFLSGLAELEVGSGERRKVGPGDVVLVTDVQGRGHITRVLSKQDVVAAWVPVP
jgi:hypothetical protein